MFHHNRLHHYHPSVQQLLDGSGALARAPIKKGCSIIINGMFGIGDNLHQRAVLKELMKTNEVWLGTCHVALYHDLIDKGLKIWFRNTRLHAQARTIENEVTSYPNAYVQAPNNMPRYKLWYNKPDIDKYGSILGAMFGTLGLAIPDRPDFSLPVPDKWREELHRYIPRWDTRKPVMIYRPIVLRKEWPGASRNPDVDVYNTLYRSIRERFFVISIACLKTDVEWIVGPEQDADLKLHNGELNFEMMSALFSESNLVFSGAGFAPILAQSVGTPCAIIYGGRESYRTTDCMGAHLSPTLGIDPIQPCNCHHHAHACNKQIDLPLALKRLRDFVEPLL